MENNSNTENKSHNATIYTQSTAPHRPAALRSDEKRVGDVTAKWTGDGLHNTSTMDIILQRISDSFSFCPFLSHNNAKMRVVDGHLECVVAMQDSLIGNVSYKILHGGFTATLLDSIGGAVAMAEIYKKGKADWAEKLKQASRLATVDLHVDYLAPGRGQYFVATGEVLRLGSKTCTVRMQCVNDENTLIAVSRAVYVF